MDVVDLSSLLRRNGLRSTPQRRAILQAFRGTAEEHLSADEVLSRASGRVPDIGRGTVYATLAELTELGMLAVIGQPEPMRYETNLDRHDHFHCRLCLRLFDVDLDGDELEERRLPGFTIEAVAVRAEGICAECDGYRRGLIDGSEEVLRQPTMAPEAIVRCAAELIATPVGELGLVASAEGIVHVAFADHADFPDVADQARSRRGPSAARSRIRAFRTTLENYFDGSPEPFPDLIDWQLSNETRAEALAQLRAVGCGDSLSYERLGIELSSYELGVCYGTNPVPLLTPCHRITRGWQPTEWYVGGAPNLHILRELEQIA